jgi:hypothetical protein
MNENGILREGIDILYLDQIYSTVAIWKEFVKLGNYVVNLVIKLLTSKFNLLRS